MTSRLLFSLNCRFPECFFFSRAKPMSYTELLWCNFVLGAIFFFPLFKNHYHTLSYIAKPLKQREKIAPRIKLHHNTN